MSKMFSKCSCLKELNLSSFNTNKVNDMSFMFFECLSLTELYLSNFVTNRKTNIESMFKGCFKELQNKISDQYPDLIKYNYNCF